MATKIRLQRQGRKRRAIYHIVATDSRVKRDGASIERLGQYNPNTHPATVNLDFDRALYWVKVGAEMSDTAKTILSNEGVLLRKHLDGGVAKGAFDEKAADKKFEAWLEEKAKTSENAAKAVADKAEAAAKAALAAETKIKEERAAAILAKNSPLVEETEEAATEEAPAEEAEAPVEAAATEEAAPVEEPAAEVATEEPKEEKAAE